MIRRGSHGGCWFRNLQNFLRDSVEDIARYRARGYAMAGTTPGILTVSYQPYFDCIQSSPNDLNRDGKYEDVNGNGRADFADIVTLFRNLDCIAADDDWQCVDFNINGRIDFTDVTWLFNNL